MLFNTNIHLQQGPINHLSLYNFKSGYAHQNTTNLIILVQQTKILKKKLLLEGNTDFVYKINLLSSYYDSFSTF